MRYQKQHGRRQHGRPQHRSRQPQALPLIYWLFGSGAFFIGASAFQLIHLGRLGHPWAFVGAVMLVVAYVGGAMTMVVRMSHDDDEWKWF